MKKFLIIQFLSLFFLLTNVVIDNYSLTGHEEFSKLEFVDKDCCLLKDMDKLYINMRLRSLPAKFVGSSTYIEYEYKDAYYIGNTIFSRSNKTREPYVFDYSLQTVEFMSRTLAIQGKLSLKASGKIKKVEASGTIDLQGSYEYKDSLQTTEKSGMTIKVFPGKKMTLHVRGEAKISSGFTKKWFFWVCFQQGAWETVDIVTSYFELVEEDA